MTNEEILREEIIIHRADVEKLMRKLIAKATDAALKHDQSKSESPEFEALTLIKNMKYGTPEYFACTRSEGIQHHYKVNRHHPEHFENGIYGMNIIDILEYFVDVTAAAMRRSGTTPQWESLAERHAISDQLLSIFKNSEILLDDHNV